nr:uncharacterized protein LOC117691389 isoform X1 [Crassostrea gigas]XP_034333305.1 uncharacterized protein LOC117691389 isoform X2 [Crassostrea gigas]
MGLYRELCFVLMGTLLFSILLLYESRKLEGYKFPVYSTEFCPRNQTEWDERSSAINCTETNGYMCLPNEQRTELIEFCYIDPFAWVEEGVCLYLIKGSSRINGYNCVQFISGCPTSSHRSSESYIFQSCFAIRNGCFIAEPSCNSTTTATTSPIETTEYQRTENGIYSTELDNTTIYEDSIKNNNNNSWVPFVAISLGIAVPVCVIYILVFFYYKQGLAADKRRSQENEYSERSPFIDRNTDSMEKGIGIDSAQGRASCKRSSDDDTHASGELKPFHEKNEQNKLDPIREESQLDQAVFEDWKDIDSKFIETNACKKVESLIQKENLVIVVGNSGSGKSATIQHIALKYRNEGWVVKKANELKDAIDAFKSNNVLENQTLFVLDDPIGKESFDEQAYKSWKIYEDDLKSCFKKFKCKMLFSCRKCVQSDKNAMGLFKNESNIVDIDADDCKLRYDEKRKIWNKYKSNNTSFEIYLTEIIKNDAYFPLLCKLFFSDEENQKDVLHFFKEPVEEFKKEIEYYKRSSKDKFCALVLLVLFNNELCVSDLQNEGNSEQMYKLALKLCGMEDCTAPSTIRGALETLHGSYVTKKGDSYQFCHDFVMEVTSYVFGTEYPKVMIQYADIGFLRKRVKLDGCNGQNDQMTIYISDLKVLTERLLKEIVGKDIFDVVLNPCLKVKKVVDAMKKNIELQQEKINLLLVKTDITLEKQNPDLRFTKLDFAGLENKLSPLCALIIFGHTDLSLHCLQALQQCSINFKDSSIFSAVCCNGAIKLFNMFSKEDIDTYLTEKWGNLYPIHIVSVFKNNEILKNLFKHKVDVNQRDEHGHTALMFTIKSNTEMSEDNNTNERHNQTLQVLLSHGADTNLCDGFGRSPLYTACENEHYSTVQLLLSNGANVNLCDDFGESPLYIACENGRDSTVQLLLSNGANVNLCDDLGESPLYIACESGRDSTVQLLLSNGADVNLCDEVGRYPLYPACKNGRDSTVQLLLSNGADVNLCNKLSRNPLYTACEKGRNSTVQLLLSNGADVNLCDELGRSLLIVACEKGHDRTVKLFLSNGADVNLCDGLGESPLYIACENGRDSTVQLLLSNGADVNLCDELGRYPLYPACKNGRNSTVQLLLSNGADVNLCNKFGESPLYTACENGHHRAVQLLLNSKANINLNKKNPALIAFYMRQHAIIKTLLDAGVNTSIVNYCQLKYVSSDWCDKDDITGQYLLRKDNIVDNMYDLDSFFSLFVFCQVEELTREYNDTL